MSGLHFRKFLVAGFETSETSWASTLVHFEHKPAILMDPRSSLYGMSFAIPGGGARISLNLCLGAS
jgi:hypothetical protein